MNQPAASAQTKSRKRSFGIVMSWTIFTTVFVWLPIVRAVARPQGYEWGFFGFRGEGISPGFWIFPLLALYAVLLLSHSWWRQRGLFRALLLLWHFGWAIQLCWGAWSHGLAATWQGQGLGISAPLWIPAVVYSAFAFYVARWAYLDWRAAEVESRPQWRSKNTRHLMLAGSLLVVAFFLFRMGTNYNWVTALAILVTIIQWVTFADALENDAAASAA